MDKLLVCPCGVFLKEPYIRCVECPERSFCLQCFAKGKEYETHKNSHAYTVVRNNFSLLDPDWIASEELKLLDAVADHGIGNWSGPSGSNMASIPSVGEGDINTQLDKKIKKFLDWEGSKGSPITERIKEELPKTKKLKQGTSVSDNEINEIILKLGKSIDICDTDKEYKEFLNKYGCIYGEGFEICGPTESTIDSKMKIEYISLKQLGFENRCKMNRMTEEEVKSCWLIAEIDQGDQYYIKCKQNKKGLVYSMDRYGQSKTFAKNFLEFLDKFFEAYEIKMEEDSEEEEEYYELTE